MSAVSEAAAMSDKPNLEAALAWAARGFNIFPCWHDKKHANISGWQRLASSDPKKIEELWQANFQPDARPGVLCGRLDTFDGPTVIDFDPRNLEKDDKQEAATPEQRARYKAVFDEMRAATGLEIATPSGGTHFYFDDFTVGNTHDRITRGVDSRGGGKGLVLAPGTVTEGKGTYTIVRDGPMGKLPFEYKGILNTEAAKKAREKKAKEINWDAEFDEDEEGDDRVDLARPEYEETPSTRLLRSALSRISADVGRDPWIKVLMSIKAHEDLSEAARLALADEWSATAPGRYDEPGDDGLSGFDSVATQMNSLSEDGGITAATVYHLADEAEHAARNTPEAIAALIEEFRITAAPGTAATIAEMTPGGTPGFFLKDDEIDANHELEPIVKDFLMVGSAACFAGKWGSGKSFGALDLGVAIATGKPTLGGLEVMKPGPVFYLTGEGDAGFRARYRACRREKEIDDSEAIDFYFKADVPQTMVNGDAEAYIAEIEARIGNRYLAVIVIDTMTKAGVGVDFDKGKEAGYYIEMTRKFQKAFPGSAILTLAHVPKNAKGELSVKGSADLEGHFDAIYLFSMAGDKKTLTIKAHKLRDLSLSEAEPIHLTLCRFDLGDGKPSAVLRTAGPSRTAMEGFEPERAREMVEAVINRHPELITVWEHGMDVEPMLDELTGKASPPGSDEVELSQWAGRRAGWKHFFKTHTHDRTRGPLKGLFEKRNEKGKYALRFFRLPDVNRQAEAIKQFAKTSSH